MRIVVYVEGPSDQTAMNTLLRPLLNQKRQEGVVIEFVQSPEGDKKKILLTKIPIRAANTILNDPYSMVAVMPDLYPKNKAFPHETVEELKAGIYENFSAALQRKGVEDDDRLKDRFRVFCFKYDLEVLILASEEALKTRLGIDHLEATWRIPVEDQDHDQPPKRIVERLFKECGKRYKGTADAPLILGASDYHDIADKCPQYFKSFVEFLTNLQPMSYD